MGHHHHGDHHHHHHDDDQAIELPPTLDTAVHDEELSPAELSRRSMFRRTGLLGAGLGVAGMLGGTATAAAQDGSQGEQPSEQRPGKLQWLAGDHHIHTQYSDDGKYRVIDQARHANAYGLDWMVVTDHGNVTHAKIGVEKVNPDIVAARREIPSTLVFQGLEWNIPGAEHGTVFVHPGGNEVSTLKEFENAFDERGKNPADGVPANEALAIAGINFLADAVRGNKVRDALFLANHPSRRGIDSPHEIRGWRDAQPRIAVGMEGAPGHQAGGLKPPSGMGKARGLYDNNPSAASFPGYPLESYRTFGGFDWMTSTVGGLWDSLLAEGKPWWITANSDSHNVIGDLAMRGPGSNFVTNGKYNDPVYSGSPDFGVGDFWPGYYSRTHVGATGFAYSAVMDGIRAGRVWVDHGGLISGLDMQLRTADRWVQSSTTIGGVLHTRRGTPVELVITVDLANNPNWAQYLPMLARLDVIQGSVTGAAADRDTFTTPTTKVVKSFEVGKSTGTVQFTYALGALDKPVYVRVRGTDGNRTAPGLLGAATDPSGPALDVVGDADPWKDLWFYSNPIWALPV